MHTQGQWARNIRPARKYGTIFAGRNTHVCYLAVNGKSDIEIEANCDLIVAAPDLLAALKAAVEIIGHPDDAVSKHFAAVIAKAEGRP